MAGRQRGLAVGRLAEMFSTSPADGKEMVKVVPLPSSL
jgi:hypothetical protein